MKNKPPRLVPCRKDDYRWMIVVYRGTQRSRLYFVKKADAERELNRIENERARLPAVEAPLSDRERDAVLESRRLGLDLKAAVESFAVTTAARSRASSLEAVVTAKLASAKQAKLSRQYMKNLTLFCDRILLAWGPTTSVADITQDQCSELLFGQGWGDVSVRYYRTLLSGIFNEGIKRRLCETNPAQFVALPKSAPGAVAILTPGECLKLLRACDRSILPGVILSMFGGLRPQSEVQRIDWSSIKLDRGFVEVAADKTKTASRRLVTVQPAMKSWLLWWSGGAKMPSSGKVWPTEITGRRRLREARAACGWDSAERPWPNDALRHSFASYHLAMWNDAAKTAHELGHQTTKLLFQHYREVVSKKEAQTFWALRPGMQGRK